MLPVASKLLNVGELPDAKKKGVLTQQLHVLPNLPQAQHLVT